MNIKSLNYTLIFFFVSGILFNLSSAIQFLPDYHSYKDLYQSYHLHPDWIQGWRFNFFFITRNFLFNNISNPDFGYLFFRIYLLVIFILSIAIFFNSLIKSHDKVDRLVTFFMILAIIIMIIDFGLIRLRAGYSISFFLFSIYFYNRGIKSLTIIFLLLSCNIHNLTFFTLLFFYLPFLIKQSKLYSNIYFVSFLNIFFIVSGILSHNYFRGPLLYSDVNIITFLLMFVFPSIYLFIRYYLFSNKSLNYVQPNFLIILTCFISIYKIFDFNFIYGEGFLRILMLSIVLLIFNFDNFIKDKIYHFYLIGMYFLYELKILLWL